MMCPLTKMLHNNKHYFKNYKNLSKKKSFNVLSYKESFYHQYNLVKLIYKIMHNRLMLLQILHHLIIY